MTTAVVRNRISYLTNNLSQRHASFWIDVRRTSHLRTQMHNKISVPVNGPTVVLKPQQRGLITCDYLHRVFRKVISACLSSGLNSLKRLAGSRASPS